MKIQTSLRYWHAERECNLRHCQRNYCKRHRLLWRDCDTAKQDAENDRGFDLGDCPKCEHESRFRTFIDTLERDAIHEYTLAIDRTIDATIDADEHDDKPDLFDFNDEPLENERS